MHERRLTNIIVCFILMLASACSIAHSSKVTSLPNSLPTITRMLISTLQPLKMSPRLTQSLQPRSSELPPSAHLGAILTGSGAVERSLLTYADLTTGNAAAPVDDGAFALPENAGMPAVVFEGRLKISTAGEIGGYKYDAASIRQKIEMDRADGLIPVPTGPGLGVDVVPEAVDEFRTELIEIK